MANGEIYITVSNKSQNVGVGVAGGNNKIGITGDNSQYFSNEARKSAEQAAQSVEEAKATLEETKTLTEEAQASIVAATENAQEAIITTKEEAIEEVEELLSKGTVTDVQVNGASILSEGVANIPIATSNDFGVVKYNTSYGVGVTSANILKLVSANNASIDNKLNQYNPITPSNLDYAVKVGVTTNTKELTSEEKTNACNWLGAAKADTALDKSQITNCLLEVPQNIKLELKDGVLTLKAGSKVIVPNGGGKFDEVVIESDLTHATTANGVLMLVATKSNLSPFYVSKCFSGSTAPTVSGSGYLWYDTTNNKLKVFNGTTWGERGDSLPIAIVTADGTSYTSIDQVFNGMGYIGSTIWVDKGVKGLIPNGRNADGSLKNIEITVNKVLAFTAAASYTADAVLLLQSGAVTCLRDIFYDYAELENLIYKRDGSNNALYFINSGKVSFSSGVITSFTPKLPFRAVDYNDFQNTPHIVDTYVNGTSWYRVWSDGWIEQGGTHSSGTNIQVNLLKNFSDTNYCVQLAGEGAKDAMAALYNNKTTSSFKIRSAAVGTLGGSWRACGY
jgi:hypothetical protein